MSGKTHIRHIPAGQIDYTATDFSEEIRRLIEFEKTIASQDDAISLRLQHIAESKNVALAAFLLRCKAMYDLSVMLAKNCSSIHAAVNNDPKALVLIEEANPVIAEFFKSHFNKSYSHAMDYVRVGKLLYEWLNSEYGDNPPIEPHMEPSYYMVAGRMKDGLKVLTRMLGDGEEAAKQVVKDFNRGGKKTEQQIAQEKIEQLCYEINRLIANGLVSVYFKDPEKKVWMPTKEEFRPVTRCWPTADGMNVR